MFNMWGGFVMYLRYGQNFVTIWTKIIWTEIRRFRPKKTIFAA